MPGKTWKDLRKKTSTTSRTATKDTDRVVDEKVIDKEEVIEQATQQSPRLSELLQQRETLEKHLHHLSRGDGDALDARDAARFRIPTFAQRQAEQRSWEAKHEQLRKQASTLRNQSRSRKQNNSVTSPNQNTTPSRGQSASTGGSRNDVTQWLARRDTQRQHLRDTARDRLSPLNDVAHVGRQFNRSVTNTSQKLRALDQQLAEKGLDQERKELNRLQGKQLDKIQSSVNKYTKIVETPMRAVNKIDHFWRKRQQQISGPMDKIGTYFDRSKRRLSTTSGGSGDLFERMQRNRKRALERNREKRREEERDEARRQRAKKNKAK